MGVAALSPAVIAQYESALTDGKEQYQWICHFVPKADALAKSASYANFSAGRTEPPPQQVPVTSEQSRAALEYAAHRGLRSLLGHLIPHDEYGRFFQVVLSVARQIKRKSTKKQERGAPEENTEHSVQLSQALVQRIFAREAESEDMAFAALALRRLQRLREVEGNLFIGDTGLPPIHNHWYSRQDLESLLI